MFSLQQPAHSKIGSLFVTLPTSSITGRYLYPVSEIDLLKILGISSERTVAGVIRSDEVTLSGGSSHLQGSDSLPERATPITSLELRGLEMTFCSQTPSHCSESLTDAALLGRIISRKTVTDRAAHL